MANKIKHIWASPNGGPAVIGHIVRSAFQNEAGETKSDVFVDGGVVALTYRDPENFDENGSGGCFWNILTDVEGSNRA